MEVKWTGITNQEAEMINLTYKSNDAVYSRVDTLKSDSNLITLCQDEQDNCLLLELFFCLHVGIYGLAHEPILQRDLKSSSFFSGHNIKRAFSWFPLTDFLMTNIGILSPKAFDVAIPVILTLLCLPPMHCSFLDAKTFQGASDKRVQIRLCYKYLLGHS